MLDALFSNRSSERMSCKESVIFFSNLAYIPYVRQNHSTFLLIATKNNLKKVISIEVPSQGLLRGKIKIMLKIKKLSKPFQ